ncbi:MAG: hypothetical protein LBB85_10155, partial [Dysgonamonadaceae bacterium]|nr:hypothetical protein [Dysgonamonadaceae bacterium]
MKWLLKMGFIGICMSFCIRAEAQNPAFPDSIPPFFVMNSDTVKTMVLRDVYIYPVRTFTSARQEEQYL